MDSDDIPNLIAQQLIVEDKNGNQVTYRPSDKLKELMKPEKAFFDLFYETYPPYVIRPDGTKSYLRINVNKCRNLYNTIVGNSTYMAEHMLDCLKYDLQKRAATGTLQYMRNMWNWLAGHLWEESEQEMQDKLKVEDNSYGNELI